MYLCGKTCEIFVPFQVALDLFGAIILSVIVDYWLCLPSILLLIIFYSFRNVYIETSRSVKRIEGISKSKQQVFHN